MKAVLDIQDSKALFVMELLRNFSFVKVRPITNEKALLLSEIKEVVEAVNLVKQGKNAGSSDKSEQTNISDKELKELLHEIETTE